MKNNLTVAQTQAMQAVSLELVFGSHGLPVQLGHHGLTYKRVGEPEYGDILGIVEGLDPSRGDVIACEGVGFDPTLTATDRVVGLMKLTGRESPYMPYDQTAETASAERLRVIAGIFAERGRRLQTADAFTYLEALAFSRSVDLVVADSDQHRVQEITERHGSYVGLGTETNGSREVDMVAGLGSIALDMNPSTHHAQSEKPKLVFVAGLNHARGVQALLDERGIPYNSRVFGKPGAGTRSEDLRDTLSSALPIIKIKDSGRKAEERWVKNLKKQLSVLDKE